MPAASKAFLIRQRSSLATPAALPGMVLACAWMTTRSAETDSRPSTSTGSQRASFHGSSLVISSAASAITARARSRSSP